MTRSRMRYAAAFLLATAVAAPRALCGEILEEVVAKVNDEVITKTDLEEREQAVMAELYRSFTGPELDVKVAEAKGMLLQRMIDDKVLLHRAQKLFDMSKIGDMYMRMFQEQQKLDDADLERALASEGITAEELKRRLIEMSAPAEVVRFEVSDRISVGDADVDVYYARHPDEFRVPARATVREIVVLAEGERQAERRDVAEAIRVRAAAPGADFAAIATEVSEAGTKTGGGLLGPVSRGDLAPTLDGAAFSVPIGGVSDVMAMPYGFHILKVEDRAEERMKPIEEVREGIRQNLSNERFQIAYEAFLKRARAEATIVVMPKYQDRQGEATQ